MPDPKAATDSRDLSEPPGAAPETAGGPGRLGRAFQGARGGLKLIMVLLLAAAGLALVAGIAFGILQSRTNYFEARNLRELDHLTAELEATSNSLGEVASVHFVPQQLHFSLSPMLECLVATTVIRGANQRPMTITYYFTDPEGTQNVARWYGDEARRLPNHGTADRPQIGPENLPADICGYRRPLAAESPRTVSIDNDVLSIERTARLTSLLWPMTSRKQPENLANCTQTGTGNAASASEGRDFIRECFKAAAAEDMRDQTFSRRGGDLIQVANQSIDAAFDSNAVRINVSTPMQAVNLESALDVFDAVQIIGAAPNQADRVVYQVGRVPPSVERDDMVAQGLITTVLGAGDTAGGATERRAGNNTQLTGARPFILDKEVVQWGDLVLFQRTVPELAGLNCHPCRIVGIVDRARFDRTVRKLDGAQATVFLIGLLTLIGFIPLLQLKLRRRLDPTRRLGQYLLWFSLTLLAASAAVSGLAIWSTVASRSAGSAYAYSAGARIREAFAAELDASIATIRNITGELHESGAVFPAPPTVPTPPEGEPAQASSATAPTPPRPPGVRALEAAWNSHSRSAIIETVSRFRGDGFVDREMSRLSTGRLPSFGTTIAGRNYFQRARNCDYDGSGNLDFVLDRVFARPDGAPRVVWLLPTKLSCDPRARRARRGMVDVLRREDFFYDPTQSAYVLASGSLRTFLEVELAPGFDYAVVDPRRNGADANVLYHSREGAELVERLQNEIDNPEEFDAAVRQLQSVDAAAGDNEAAARATAQIDTNYRGRPSRLTVSRLSPSVGWLLVMIEDRNDAGYEIWRAVTFGYTVWFFGVLVIGVLLMMSHIRASRSLDRRPSLWLWPQARLADFTPPRIDRHDRMRDRLRDGAVERDWHIWLTALAGIGGVAAGEAGSRILFAAAAAFAVMAARAYFRGLTAFDDRLTRRVDRWIILTAGVLLVAAIVVFIPGMVDEYRFGGFGARGSFPAIMMIIGRVALFGGAAVLIFALLREALPHTRDVEKPLPVRSKASLLRRLDGGWMAGLLVLGGLPACAGFLDSHDYDRRLVVERTHHIQAEGNARRQQAATALIYGRVLPLPQWLIDEIEHHPLRPESRLDTAMPTSGCLAASCLAIDYLGLREQAQEYSDFASFRLTDAIGGRFDPVRIIGLLLLIAMPVGIGWLAMVLFRNQYFRRSPLLSPGKDPDFDPPLSLTRAQFVDRALVPAARGEDPDLPFAPAGGNLHLILGAGLDLRDDWWPPKPLALSSSAGEQGSPRQPKPKRLGEIPGIAWVDLLDEADPEPQDERAVVIGNLDLALQGPEPESVETARRRITTIVGPAGAHHAGDRHVFLLAEIDPLDRIALMWNRQTERHNLRRIDAWRWAELIQDFTLFPILVDGKVELVENETRVERAIREELGVLDTSFASEMREQLLSRFATADEKTREATEGAIDESAADGDEARRREERIISFITEQMSDHYHKLWTNSSTEEQVVLFQIARDAHLKMRDSLALRALLARGLLIRVPEYRLMNRSFARYVLRVGAPSEMQRGAEEVGGVDQIWPLIRLPIAAIAASAVLLLQFVAPSSGSAAVGALPALLSLVPAVLGRWLQDRGAAG